MQPFRYHAPTTVGQAADLLASAAGGARALAGGTDLMVQMRRGDLKPSHVIDVKGIPELRTIRHDQSGLHFGAAVTCAELCERDDLRRDFPGLVDAAGLIGGTAVQRRATVGGNLCNAAPSADAVPALIVLDAVCVVTGPRGQREVKASEFCTAPGSTVLDDGELLVALRIAPPAQGSAGAYLRFIPRGEMDIAIAGVAVWLSVEGDTIVKARVALAAVAATPLAVPAVGTFLAGKRPEEAVFEEAGDLAAQAATPISDHRGSAAQRRHLVTVLTRRSLGTALERAREGASR